MRALWTLAVLALFGPAAASRCTDLTPLGVAHSTLARPRAALPTLRRAGELHRPARPRPPVQRPPRLRDER